jgi:hypothetical protein
MMSCLKLLVVLDAVVVIMKLFASREILGSTLPLSMVVQTLGKDSFPSLLWKQMHIQLNR